MKHSKLGIECLVGDGAHASLERLSEGVPYLSSKNFKREGLDLTELSFISESNYEKYFNKKSKALTKPQSQDLILSIIGSIVGVPYLVRAGDEFGISSSVALIRPQSNVYSLYLFYYLKTSGVQTYIEAIKGGSAQGFLSLEMIRSIPIAFPDLPTQKRIAGILSAYDELIEVNNQRIRLQEDTARQLYKEWFVRLRFPGYEQTKFVKGLPEGWSEIYFRDFIKLNRGFDLPEDQIVEGEYPVVASTSIKAYHNQYKVEAPCVATGRSGSLGTVQYINLRSWPLNTSLYVKDFKGNSPKYVYYFLQSLKLESFNAGAGVPSLNQNHLHGLKFALPPKGLQKRFDQIINPIFLQVETLQSQNTQLRQIRDRLLPRLIGGKLSVDAVKTVKTYDTAQV